MSRNYKSSEITKIAKAKRNLALARNEFREPSSARVPASGATSFPVKADDPETARLVAEFEAKRVRA